MSTTYSNELPEGVTAEMLASAIERSGYPLQSWVARQLDPTFEIQPEWSYRDNKSGDVRAVDLLAQRELYSHRTSPPLVVRPHLSLVIECKRSTLPVVFFESGSRMPEDFPVFGGLKSRNLTLAFTEDRSGTYLTPVALLLGLEDQEFVRAGVPLATSVAGCARKGSTLELTGTEVFHGITQPLSKAADYFLWNSRPVPTAMYFDLHAVICVAVMAAPMFVTNDTMAAPKTAEWVRLVRHEHDHTKPHRLLRERLSVIDVVHAGFLPRYISEFVLPLGESIGSRAKQCESTLAAGKGLVTGVNDNAPVYNRVRTNRMGLRRRLSLWANHSNHD